MNDFESAVARRHAEFVKAGRSWTQPRAGFDGGVGRCRKKSECVDLAADGKTAGRAAVGVSAGCGDSA
ncbi:hypothetical protein [Variovorax sp. 38R]|uniref:hypothetical protein n=1 Tax=Variovorax sp. 38R TaxID=2774875 RepID=UPI00177AB0DF|nr:hypothetical protein [Variovorax sp. 38R]QOF77615.1 hypothetical protein IG196_25225 [Variovorax sp. 38R]